MVLDAAAWTEELDDEQLASEIYTNHKTPRPGTHWRTELHGYYDTDEEVEQNNTNDQYDGRKLELGLSSKDGCSFFTYSIASCSRLWHGRWSTIIQVGRNCSR
jgi:hypothetical protein